MEQDIAKQILSDVTVHMKYARYINSLQRRETWKELVTRNKKMHIKKFPELKEEINSVYKHVYDRKVLPSMRSMQFGGKPIEVAPNRIFNCAYTPIDDWRAFSETMFLLLGGTGVGYSVQRHHVEQLPDIQKPSEKRTRRFLVNDSIEGWSDAVKALMRSYFFGGSKIRYDYSDIRPKGSPLLTSGGTAPGPQPLKECLVKIDGVLREKETGDRLTTIEVHDIICYIADAVLAGGIRRAALISLLMRHMITKEYFQSLWNRVRASGCGEPGFYFSNDKEWGTNPCCEIALRPHQFCNLVEINASDISSQEEYEERCRAATFIATLQASYTDFHYLREIWRRTTEKDALIGVSMTGIASGKVLKLDMSAAAKEVIKENKRVAKLLDINPAARTTCVKPAGTTSLTLGTSSGIHAWHDRYYIRRLRVGKSEAMYEYLATNHPELVEDEYFRPHDTAVISVPQSAPWGSILRTESALSMLERVKRVGDEWTKPGHKKGSNTHNVSATVSVKEKEWDEVGEWMWENRNSYNGLSVLPYDDKEHTYVQAPFESCTKEKYEELVEALKKLDLKNIIEYNDNTDLTSELACSGGSCSIIAL